MSLVITDQYHRRDHTRHNYSRQRPEDNVIPLYADPITMPAVAAAVNLGFQDMQNDAFPEFPPASFDVIRLTAWTLHGQESSRRFRNRSE